MITKRKKIQEIQCLIEDARHRLLQQEDKINHLIAKATAREGNRRGILEVQEIACGSGRGIMRISFDLSYADWSKLKDQPTWKAVEKYLEGE